MLRGLLKLAFASIWQKWINALIPTALGPEPAFPAIQPNTARLKALARKSLTLAGLLFLSVQFFLGGIIIAIVAAAHSFDIYQQFQSTAVFWVGLVMAFAALAGGGLCGYFLAHLKVTRADLLVEAAADVHDEPLHIAGRLLRSLTMGVLEGLRQPRATLEAEPRRRYPAA